MDAVRAGVDNEQGNAGRRAGGDDELVRGLAIDDESLAAVELPAIAGPRGRDGDVALAPQACAFADRHGRDGRSVGDARQQRVPLILAPGQQDRVAGHDRARQERCAEQRAALFLHGDAELDRSVSGTAIGFGQVQPRKAHFAAGLAPDVGVEAFGGRHQPAHGARRRLVLQEARQNVPELLLFR